jgi:fibronectin-binding autotransporter adhesin
LARRILLCIVGIPCLLTLACAARGATITNSYAGTQTVSGYLTNDPPDILAVQVASGIVTFTGANAYSGGTEVLGGSTNVAYSTSPLGSGDVAVRSGGALQLDQRALQGVTLANSFYLNGGSTLQNISGPWNAATTITLSNNVFLGGAATVVVGSPGETFSTLRFSGVVRNDGGSAGSLTVRGGEDPAHQQYLQLYGNNAYSGGTTIGAYGYVWAGHSNALGTASLNVQSNGQLWLVSGVTVTNDIAFQDGSLLRSKNGNEGLDGTITLNGTASLYSGYDGAALILYLNRGGGRITGAGGLNLYRAYWNTDSGDRFYLYGDNDYTGTTAILNGAQATAFHANAFGVNANTVLVQSASANGISSVAIDSTLAAGLHPNKTLRLNANGLFYQPRGTALANAQILAGGGLRFVNGGAGVRTNSGPITAVSGTTSAISSGSSGGDQWYQTGTMSGSGAIVLSGYRNDNDTYLHFNGENSGYSGTITDTRTGGFDRRYVGSDNGLGTGSYVMQGATTNDTMLRLDRSVTLANVFAGTGKVDGQFYTLTHTGTLAPGATNVIGGLAFASTGAGKLDFRGTYRWKYDATTNDSVGTGALVFGNPGGQATLNVSWIGAGEPPAPPSEGATYTLFKYAGIDPAIMTPWTVTTLGKLRGEVSVEAAAKRVILTLKPPPAGILFVVR